ncbi:MAG: metallophosphoesterase [Kiritimatiellae bacterium]|nr:metallophosphoesterase [Kiritimatiellia bacterium]
MEKPTAHEADAGRLVTGISRRHFLRAVVLGAAACAAGLAPRAQAAPFARRRPGRLKLAFFTDIHAREEWDTPEALRRCAAAINAAKPDLVIAGGDLITDGFEFSAEKVAPRWDVYMELHRAIRAPVEVVLGNHDLVAAMPEDGSPPAADPRQIFREKFGIEQTYRSFDAGGYHFILLDSTHVTGGPLKYEGRIWPAQLEWLEEDLARTAKETPIVLVTHIPLLTVQFQSTLGIVEPPPANRVVVNNLEVLDAFRDHKLLLVLQGHMHVEEVIKRGGTTFITGGAVCAKWWRGPYYGTEEGFGLVTLDGDRVGWEYVDYGWDAQRPADR